MDYKYEKNLVSYLKNLKDVPRIVDEHIRKSTMKSIVNHNAHFLDIKCKICSTEMVDITGLKIIRDDKPYRCAKCGACGNTELVSYYSRVKI